MNKLKTFLSKNYKKILFILLFLIIAILIIFFNTLEIRDELWLFHHIYKISSGYTIYSDVNVIITPIFFYVGKLFLLLLGKKIIIFRIYNLFIFTTLYIVSYKLMKNLNFSKHIAFLSTILLFFLCLSVVNAGANYNSLVIIFVLLGITLYIKRNKNFLLHGLIMFLVFFTKQNIGVFYFIAMILIDFYLYKFSKSTVTYIFKKFCCFLILSAILLLQMFFTGNLLSFFNFCFGGLLDFGKQNIKFSVAINYLIIFISTFLLYFFILLKRKTLFAEIINKEDFINLTILIIFTAFISLMVYPIFNSGHFLCAMPLHFITIMYIFNLLLINDFYGNQKYAKYCDFIAIIILLIIIGQLLFAYKKDIQDVNRILDFNSPFFAIPIRNKYIENRNIIKDYIIEQNNNGIDVIIISEDNSIPIIELNQNHLMYDLLFEGNLGYNGKNKIKNDIISRENTQFLIITNEDEVFTQQPLEIRNFIIENLNFKGTICNYSIYQK